MNGSKEVAVGAFGPSPRTRLADHDREQDLALAAHVLEVGQRLLLDPVVRADVHLVHEPHQQGGRSTWRTPATRRSPLLCS